ncbi:YajQ family cyclic di-GMP-binding protein [Streptomyces californicus]
MEANGEERVKAILDIFQSKLIKRGISLKSLDAGEPQLSGKEYKIFASIEEGISQENAKKVAKTIRDEGPKGVKAQVQGDGCGSARRAGTTCRPFRRC